MEIETKAIHAGYSPDPTTNAVAVPTQGCEQFLKGCAKRNEFQLSPQSAAAAAWTAGTKNDYEFSMNPKYSSMSNFFRSKYPLLPFTYSHLNRDYLEFFRERKCANHKRGYRNKM